MDLNDSSKTRERRMDITLTHPAPPGTCYGPNAFADDIGTEIPVFCDTGAGTGLLLEAQVAEDGMSARLRLEVAREIVAGAFKSRTQHT